MRKTLMMSVIASLSACAIDGEEDGAEDVETSETEQDITGWSTGAWGTLRDLVGADTGWDADVSTCVMTAVTGDLGEGGYWQSADHPSAAWIKPRSNGNYYMIAHGGAYANQTNTSSWADNKVMVGAVCVPYPKSAEAQYKSGNLPVKISNFISGRRCFLNGISGGGQIFTHSNDTVRIRKITTTDSKHPTTGWYLEGTLSSNPYTGQPAYASAYCIDCPSISAEWGWGYGPVTNQPMTSGTGKKMCGLVRVHGAFNVNSWTNGVTLNPPSTQTGNWTLTVSSGKYAEVNCIQ
jgi:hypothetical protein